MYVPAPVALISVRLQGLYMADRATQRSTGCRKATGCPPLPRIQAVQIILPHRKQSCLERIIPAELFRFNRNFYPAAPANHKTDTAAMGLCRRYEAGFVRRVEKWLKSPSGAIPANSQNGLAISALSSFTWKPIRLIPDVQCCQ